MPQPPPTLRELSEQLGISIATISLALRNDPRVAPATRERVLAAATRAGYKANPLVSALMTQVRQRHRERRSGEVIAYLTSYDHEDFWKAHPSHLHQFEGARHRAEELGFDLQPIWLGPGGAHSRRAGSILHNRGICGSLLAPLPANHRTLDLNWNEHPIIAIGYSFTQVALHRAANHTLNAMLACYSNLRKFGFQRIGLALHQTDDSRVKHAWRSGFLGGRNIHGGEEVEMLFLSDYDRPAPFQSWFERERPDAVIGIWRDHPLEWLRKRGCRVPEEIGYASLDLGEDAVGRIAGILQDNYNVGAAAMDLLANQLFCNETGIPTTPRVTLIESTWMDGPTVSHRTGLPSGPQAVP